MKDVAITKVPRRKHVDARQTVRAMARKGGLFREFQYKPSPSLDSASTKPLELLIVGDVSGSMGRYIAVVLHLLSSLHELASVKSYIFSDTPTYVGIHNTSGSFHTMYEDLQKRATSWAYGTRLSIALGQIRREHRYSSGAVLLLITDGGFSLIGDDWPETLHHMTALYKEVDRIVVATPNSVLLKDGPACGERFWELERRTKQAHDIISSPALMKIARFGLLAQYSDGIIPCTTVDDVRHFVESLCDTLNGQ